MELRKKIDTDESLNNVLPDRRPSTLISYNINTYGDEKIINISVSEDDFVADQYYGDKEARLKRAETVDAIKNWLNNNLGNFPFNARVV